VLYTDPIRYASLHMSFRASHSVLLRNKLWLWDVFSLKLPSFHFCACFLHLSVYFSCCLQQIFSSYKYYYSHCYPLLFFHLSSATSLTFSDKYHITKRLSVRCIVCNNKPNLKLIKVKLSFIGSNEQSSMWHIQIEMYLKRKFHFILITRLN